MDELMLEGGDEYGDSGFGNEDDEDEEYFAQKDWEELRREGWRKGEQEEDRVEDEGLEAALDAAEERLRRAKAKAAAIQNRRSR